jgi:mannosyltransferase OCH1-like enzyme
VLNGVKFSKKTFMPLRIVRTAKPAPAPKVTPAAVKPVVAEPVKTTKELKGPFIVTDRVGTALSNVQLRAGCGPVHKTAYENTQPIPHVHVHYQSPHELTVLVTQPKSEATLEIAPVTDKNAVPINLVVQPHPRQWKTTISIPWTISDDLPAQHIPRIIHQTYITRELPAESYSACQTWWLTNPEYQYRFYDDELSQTLMEQWYPADAPELQAYNMLYAGAYKSDIFRLALLFREGGVWADVSSVCEAPISSYIQPEDELVVCVDSPCQKRYANIHQAYLFVVPGHPAIEHILAYTVRTVIHRRFETPGMVFQSIAVTGPTAFAEGLNDFMKRRPLEYFDPEGEIHLFKDNDTSVNPFRFTPFITDQDVRFLDHRNGRIWTAPDTVVITTKFPNFSQFRTNVHYSVLGNMGYIYKEAVPVYTFGEMPILTAGQVFHGYKEDPADKVWQVWLQTNYVSHQMAAAMRTWHNIGDQYCFVTEAAARQQTLHLMPEVWQAIDLVRPHAYKCDLLRALLLYIYGGLYVDADMVCLQSLDALMTAHKVILLSSGPEQVDNGLMYFDEPGHPLLLHYLQRAVAQIKARVSVASDLALTGPRLWTACVQEYWGWSLVPSESVWQDVAIMRHEAITESYATSAAVQELQLTGLPAQALRTVAPGTTVVTWNDVPYVCTKYPDYNKERLIMGGTNFAAEFQAGSIFRS